jgi:hypothetical protein
VVHRLVVLAAASQSVQVAAVLTKVEQAGKSGLLPVTQHHRVRVEVL